MGMGGGIRWLAQSRWIEAFLLRDAARVAASCPSGRLHLMRSFVRADEMRRRAADDLIDGFAVASLTLYREAAVLYMAAQLSVEGLVAANETLPPERVVARFGVIDLPTAPPCSDGDFQAF